MDFSRMSSCSSRRVSRSFYFFYSFRSSLLILAMLLLQFVSTACMTTMSPIRPSKSMDKPIEGILDAKGQISASAPNIRFDSESIVLREGGTPLAPSLLWKREVANYTAKNLNELLATPVNAEIASTVVSFDLAIPTALQFGPWKEMAITMVTTLPNGNVIRSKPVIANIDDWGEYLTTTGIGVAGSALEIGSAIASVVFVLDRSPSTQQLAGWVFLGTLLGGLTLNASQGIVQYVNTFSEERRWSDLYAQALVQHAKDVKAGLLLPPPAAKPKTPVNSNTNSVSGGSSGNGSNGKSDDKTDGKTDGKQPKKLNEREGSKKDKDGAKNNNLPPPPPVLDPADGT